MRYKLVVLALAMLVPTAVAAQTNAAKAEVPHAQVLSTNPFGLMLKWVNGEYERKIGPATTAGISGSYFVGEATSNVAAFARWYSAGAALDGFYLGARVGAFRITTADYVYDTPPPSGPQSTRGDVLYPTIRERTKTLPGAGLEIGYNRLLGAERNISIGVGFGLSRLFGEQASYDLPEVWPNIRLVNIGIAF
jgi:hypothetical protein